MNQSKVHLALKLFNRIDPELALKYRESLEKYIRKEMWALYELMIGGTEEEVYTEYGKTLNDLERAASYQHDLYIKAKKLAACIAQNGWITENEIDLVLKEELKEQWFSFNGILTVYMIGLLKLEKYIPLLTSLLVRDEDILLEEVATVLIGFQSDKVVKDAAPYLTQPESSIFAASVVENIKTDLAVQILRHAYHEAEEIGEIIHISTEISQCLTPIKQSGREIMLFFRRRQQDFLYNRHSNRREHLALWKQISWRI